MGDESMAKGNFAQKKEKKKSKKNKGIKGNGYSQPLGRTYPGTIQPFPNLPGTSGGVS
jgi:hypothetical protein